MSLVAREGDYLFPADLFELTAEQRIEVGRELIRQRGIEQVNSFFSEIVRRNALAQQKSGHTDIFLPCTHESAEQRYVTTESEAVNVAGAKSR